MTQMGTRDAKLWTPQQIFQKLSDDMRDRDSDAARASACVVVFRVPCEGEDGHRYFDFRYYASRTEVSETIGLLEIAKQILIGEMFGGAE